MAVGRRLHLRKGEGCILTVRAVVPSHGVRWTDRRPRILDQPQPPKAMRKRNLVLYGCKGEGDPHLEVCGQFKVEQNGQASLISWSLSSG